MKRTLLGLAVLFCIGCGVGATVRMDIRFIAILIFISLCFSCYSFFKYRQISCLIYLLVFLCGFLSCSLRIKSLEESSNAFWGNHITVGGQISGDVEKNGSMSTYTLYADSIEKDGKLYKRDISVKVIDYRNKEDYIVPFNHVLLTGNMDMKESYKNTGSFSYNSYLLEEGISGILVADHMSDIKSFPSSKRPLENMVYKIKEGALEKLDRYLNNESSGLMKGILFGDTSGISEDEYSSFEESGIIHIFAVSGYNIWLLYMILNYVLFFLRYQKTLKAIIIVCIMWFYVLLSGCSPSVMRAFIMSAVIIFGKLTGRETDPLTSLSFSAVIILLINPLMITDAGFQLSYVCVASIILLYPKFEKMKIPFSILKKSISSYLSVQIGILPLVAYYFNNLPVLSILANMTVVPLVSLFTIMGIIFFISSVIYSGAACFTGRVINMLGSVITGITDMISGIPYSSVAVTSPDIWQIMLYYFIVCALLGILKLNERQRKTAVLSILIIILCTGIFENIPSRLVINFIDVGQGDCILISTPDRKHILIDGGGKAQNAYSTIDIGEDVLVPYLLKHDIKNIDMIISTHSHDDHLKGLLPVISRLETGSFVKSSTNRQNGYSPILDGSIIKSGKIVEVSKDDVIKAGRYVNIYVLSPGHEYEDENDSSIVLRLVYKNFSALFTGDIGVDVENELKGVNLRSDVLKVPHHGSENSFSNDFIDNVDPEAAVICVGRNSFGHPSKMVVDGLLERGIKLFRTDINGEITVTTDGSGFGIKTFK